jgi:hypothetical protein
MPSAEFEPTIPVSERQQNYALDRAATGIGIGIFWKVKGEVLPRTGHEDPEGE